MKTRINFEIDTDTLTQVTDEHLAQLWHISQANPVEIDNREAGQLAEHVAREIVRRFLAATPPALWAHQGCHADWCLVQQLKAGSFTAGDIATAAAEGFRRGEAPVHLELDGAGRVQASTMEARRG